MMTFLWGLLTSKLAGPIAATGAAFLAVALTFQILLAGQVETDLRHRLDAVTAGLATCRVNYGEASSALDAQGAAVEAMRVAGALRTASAEKALQQARSETAKALSRQATLAATPEPADQCSGVADILLKGVQ